MIDTDRLARPLVVGFGLTGQAVVAALQRRGHQPTVVDDRASEASIATAAGVGIELIAAPSTDELAMLIADASVVLPSPGIPDHHPLFALARDAKVPIWSEFDLASLWDDRMIVGITGTNGKTTVTLLVTDALERSGLKAAAVGNMEVPLVAAIEDSSIDVFVVEASSFRLAHSDHFAPNVAAWINFAPDHLDAHATLADYEAAKASIFANLGPTDVAIVNAEDEAVMAHRPPTAATVTFGLRQADWSIIADQLVGPDGPVVAVRDLHRSQPHDLANAAAVGAIASAAGATTAGIAAALQAFEGFAHRLQLVGTWNDVSWYNDSKATVPHATAAAVGGFDSVVLIAGGKNKGLDMSSLASLVPPVRAVVATGAAADEIAGVFGERVPITTAHTMDEAIRLADEFSQAGDAVLLSPACTSYDWYDNYEQRGDDFMARVRAKFQ